MRSVRAEEIEGEHGDGPSGRLEWVIKRAYDRKYDTTDDYKVDVERTWAFLEDKWTREGATSRLDAVRVVRAYFDNKWTSRGIGELGGIVCVPSVGISRESLQIPKSTSVLSLDSMAATSAGSDGANTTQVRLGREDKDLFPRSDVALANERVQNQLALEKCKYLLENFINQPEAVNFRDPHRSPHGGARELRVRGGRAHGSDDRAQQTKNERLRVVSRGLESVQFDLVQLSVLLPVVEQNEKAVRFSRADVHHGLAGARIE